MIVIVGLPTGTNGPQELCLLNGASLRPGAAVTQQYRVRVSTNTEPVKVCASLNGQGLLVATESKGLWTS